MKKENDFQPSYRVLPSTEKSKEWAQLNTTAKKSRRQFLKKDLFKDKKRFLFFFLVQEANSLKEKGNLDFKSGNFPSALRSYHKVLIILLEYTKKDIQDAGLATVLKDKEKNKPILSEEERKIIDELHHLTLLNMSQIYLFQKKFEKVIESVNKALIVRESEKGRFRRAKAYIEINEFEKAKEDLKIVEKLTGDKCEELIKLIKEKEIASNKKLADGMKKLFC
jgi:tetratricopeptide (TPR) repeat protein